MSAVEAHLPSLAVPAKYIDSCETQWTTVLPEPPDAAGKTYLTRKMKGTVAEERERVRRAAGAVHLLKTKFECEPHPESEDVPLRWGKLATTGIASFEKMLHATSAGLAHNEAVATLRNPAGTIQEAMAKQGECIRHIRHMGDWEHDSAHTPYLFSKPFKDKAELLLNGLWAAGRPAAADSPPAENTKTIGILQTCLGNPEMQKHTALKRACTKLLSDTLFVAWGRPPHTDPRPGPTPRPTENHEKRAVAAMDLVAPTATWHREKNPAPADVVKFYEVACGVNPSRVAEQRALTITKGIADPLLNVTELTKRYTGSKQLPERPEALTVAPAHLLGYSE